MEERKAIVEGLIYEDSIHMIAAPPGVGKSMLSTQTMLQISNGLPVFGHLKVMEPATCLYLQSERPISEILERMKIMSGNMEINHDRIIVDNSLQGLDLMNLNHQEIAMQRLRQIYHLNPFKLVFMDPIYAMVAGGLSKDEPASAFCRFSANVQSTFNTTNILIHHTNRGNKDEDGNRIGADMYGSVWLEAHVTGLFMVNKREKGTKLQCLKNSHGNLIERIELEYDLDSHLSTITESSLAKMPGKERLMMYLRACRNQNSTFTISDILAQTALSRPQFYRLHETIGLEKSLQCVKSIGKKKIWKYTGS